MAVKGDTANAKEVKARWGFGEVLSDRFGHSYKQILSPALYAEIKGGGAFSDLQQADWDPLIQGLNTARLPSFTGGIDQCGANGYVCSEWSVEDLLRARVIPYFFGVRYGEFLTMAPREEPPGQLNPADPRCKAWQVPLTKPFTQTEPVISVNPGSGHILVEGYTRSLLWVRNPTKPLLVWTSVL